MALSIRFWPRSIQWQMLVGLLLLESLSIGLFAFLLVRQQTREIGERAVRRLAYEANSLALQASEALQRGQPGWVGLSVKMLGNSPTVAQARVTDANGNMLFVAKGEADESVLEPAERAQINLIGQNQSKCFAFDSHRTECVHAIYTGQELRGLAWVEYNWGSSQELLASMLRATEIFGVIWLAASTLLVLLMSHSIVRPLAILHRGARALMNSPENTSNFPLPVDVQNEVGDLVETFNRMVASLAEQRSGLNDTLSLLDSMLANAPVGLAFIDRDCRIVRVNKVFADLTGVALNRHLGRTLPELLPQPVAHDIENAVLSVFSSEQPVDSFELDGQGSSSAGAGKSGSPYT